MSATTEKTNESEIKSPHEPGSTQKVVRQALAMAFGTSSSRVLGLVREVAFAALFSRSITDAWIAAFRLPNLFRRLFGEGSLSVSFVPVFVEARVRDENAGGGRTSSRDLLDGFFTLLAGFLAVLTVLGVLFPEPFLSVMLDPSYAAQAEKWILTIRLTRIMFSFVFLICLYAFFMGVLNALGIFGLPAMAPMLFNVAMIGSTLMPMDWFPTPGDGLAWGVVAGGVAQMAILIPALSRRGFLPRFRFCWNVDIQRVLKNMLPGFAGLGLLQVTTIVNMRFASQLGEGPISWVNWADRLLELPLSLISVSLGTALLPTLADLWSRGDRRKMSETLNFSLRLNIFACAAAAAGLFVLAEPIVRVIFEHGRFSPEDTLATAAVVRVWSLIMIPTACVRVLAPSYYAVKNTWFPAVVSAFCLAVHISIAPLLMGRWGLTGLNVSSLVSSVLNLILLLAFYQRLVTEFNYGKVFWQGLKYLGPVMALVGAAQVHRLMDSLAGPSFGAQILGLSVSIGLSGLAYGLTSHWIGLEEWSESVHRLISRLGRRFSRAR